MELLYYIDYVMIIKVIYLFFFYKGPEADQEINIQIDGALAAPDQYLKKMNWYNFFLGVGSLTWMICGCIISHDQKLLFFALLFIEMAFPFIHASIKDEKKKKYFNLTDTLMLLFITSTIAYNHFFLHQN